MRSIPGGLRGFADSPPEKLLRQMQELFAGKPTVILSCPCMAILWDCMRMERNSGIEWPTLDGEDCS